MGIAAEPEEVEAVLHNLCGFHLAERDPVSRFIVLTREQVLYDALVAAIKRERGRALAELVEQGHKLTEIAELTGLGSRQRVQRLIQVGAAAERLVATQAVAEVQEASRQFDERLDAVEATLDEVVSGIPVLNEAATPNVVSELTDEYGTVMAKEPYVVERFGSHPVEPGAGNDSFADYERYADDEPFDPLTADLDEVTGMLEPTQVMPALSAVLHPTKELTAEDEEPWWRRANDNGAA
jgi:hypothetical protein